MTEASTGRQWAGWTATCRTSCPTTGATASTTSWRKPAKWCAAKGCASSSSTHEPPGTTTGTRTDGNGLHHRHAEQAGTFRHPQPVPRHPRGPPPQGEPQRKGRHPAPCRDERHQRLCQLRQHVRLLPRGRPQRHEADSHHLHREGPFQTLGSAHTEAKFVYNHLNGRYWPARKTSSTPPKESNWDR